MIENDGVFNKIAEALLLDYSSVYYVNAVTNEYKWYSIKPEFHSLQIEEGGDDFFKNMSRDVDKVVYEEDKHIFKEDMQKEKLLNDMKSGTMQNIVYRLMIDRKPVWHTLRVIRSISENGDYFILGIINIDKEMKAKLEAEKIEKEREIFNQISESLARHFDTLYYINIETDHYLEFSSTDIYKSLDIPAEGEDFFAESRKNIKKYIYKDDQEKVLKIHYKEEMLNNLKKKSIFSMKYRLIVAGGIMYCRYISMLASDKKHIIVCIEDINEEMLRENELTETQKKNLTYSQIVESLAAHYDVIYYVDSKSGSYTGYTSNRIYGNLEIQEKGEDFFEDARSNIEILVHVDDRKRILRVLDKAYILSVLNEKKQFGVDYRLMVDNEIQYTRFTVMWASDKIHFIIGVENINEEVIKENALRTANEMARRDELTGAKNKLAYQELEDTMQNNIDNGIDYFPFAIVVCDLNDLKAINDTLGHKAGDEYIKVACKMICDTYLHSPVFRVGGDEFAVVLSDRDYAQRDILIAKLQEKVLDNLKTNNGPVVASGMAEYEAGSKIKVSKVFEQADVRMYENKRSLKEML